MPENSKSGWASRSIIVMAALLMAPSLGGCCTIGGLASDEYSTKVYVGMQVYVDTCGETEHGIPGWLLFFWDVPLSLALDTILFPGTLTYEILRTKK